MKRWYEKIIAVHTAVTTEVRHGEHLHSDRYFVWQEDGADDFEADGIHAEKAVTGTTDLFTKREFDPWRDQFEEELDAAGVSWELLSVTFEQQTGYWHYEWEWTVGDG